MSRMDGAQAAEADVRSAYALLLGRPPEAEALATALGQPTGRLFDALLSSSEFHNAFARPVAGDAVPGRWLGLPVAPEVAHWARSEAGVAGAEPGSLLALTAAVVRRRALDLRSSASFTEALIYVAERADVLSQSGPEAAGADRGVELAVRRGVAQHLFTGADGFGTDLALRCLRLLDSGLFDSAYYLAHNLDVAAAGVNAVEHYVRHGDEEGRRPNRRFDPAAWRRLHGLAPKRNALEHALRHGWAPSDGESRGSEQHPAAAAPSLAPRPRPAPKGGQAFAALSTPRGEPPRHVRDSRIDHRLDRLRRMFGDAVEPALIQALLDAGVLLADSGSPFAALLADAVVVRHLLSGRPPGALATREGQLIAVAAFCLYTGEARGERELAAIPRVAAAARAQPVGATRWPALPLDALTAGCALLAWGRADSAGRARPDLDTTAGRSDALAEVVADLARQPAMQALIPPSTREALRGAGGDQPPPIADMLWARPRPAGGPSAIPADAAVSWEEEVWLRDLTYLLSEAQLAAGRVRLERTVEGDVLHAPRLARLHPTWPLLRSQARRGHSAAAWDQLTALARDLPPAMVSGELFDTGPRTPPGRIERSGRFGVQVGVPQQLTLSSSGARGLIGQGWSHAEPDQTWTIAPTALLAFDLPEEAVGRPLDLHLTVRRPQVDDAFLTVRWNRACLGRRWSIGAQPETFVLPAPGSLTQTGACVLAIAIDHLSSPPADSRSLGVAVRDFRIVLR